MTQGREGTSLAHRAALRCLADVRRLSALAMVVSTIAFLAGSAGTSYARHSTGDTVVVSNFGTLFAGSVETFAAGSFANSPPTIVLRGPATLLGASNGASGLAQSSVDGDIAVALTLGVPVPPFVFKNGTFTACPDDCHLGHGAHALTCEPRTQFDCVTTSSPGSVAVFPAGATGNTAPEQFIDGGTAAILNNTFEGPFGEQLDNNTGLFLPQGVAFNDPFLCLDTSNPLPAICIGKTPSQSLTVTDQFAVANFGQVVAGSADDFLFCGVTTLPTFGTITEYNSGDTGNVSPTPAVVTFEVPIPPATVNPPNPASDLTCTDPTTCHPVVMVYAQNATIGGCLTDLFAPVGLTFDRFGDLWVANEGSFALGSSPVPFPAPFITEYEAGAFGDASPINIVGLTPGTFVNPLFVAVGTDPTGETDHQILYVTDAGDNTVKIFDVNEPFVDDEIGVIHGPNTLQRPEGIALAPDGDLYVVSNMNNSLVMYDATTGGGPPKVIIKGPQSKMSLPIGVALPQFHEVTSAAN